MTIYPGRPIRRPAPPVKVSFFPGLFLGLFLGIIAGYAWRQAQLTHRETCEVCRQYNETEVADKCQRTIHR